jgi:hypothetical protein
MVKSVLIVSLLAIASTVPLGAQGGPFTFNMGGGISAPLNPTGQYAGTSGNFAAGAGYRINKQTSIVAEYMWSGLPPNLFVLHPIGAPSGTSNLNTLTANYRYEIDRIHNSRFGVYAIAGGGWYYRHTSVDQNYTVPPNTVCQPIYGWWGYACDPNGYVYSQTVASRGSSAGGVNGGVGFTISLGDSAWKFYSESRYHYGFNSTIPSTLVPVTFGIRLN